MRPSNTQNEDFLQQEDIIGMVNDILRSGRPGILSTLDFNGAPQSRWMATSSFDEFPRFHTLTSSNSQKVEQIEAHPIVQWMFSSSDLDLVVNLTGRAHILLPDAATVKRIWREIADKSRAYFLGDSDQGPGFSIIETMVELVECTLPALGQKFFVDPHQVHPGRKEALRGGCGGPCCGRACAQF